VVKSPSPNLKGKSKRGGGVQNENKTLQPLSVPYKKAASDRKSTCHIVTAEKQAKKNDTGGVPKRGVVTRPSPWRPAAPKTGGAKGGAEKQAPPTKIKSKKTTTTKPDHKNNRHLVRAREFQQKKKKKRQKKKEGRNDCRDNKPAHQAQAHRPPPHP